MHSKRDESELGAHGKEAVNFQISIVIYNRFAAFFHHGIEVDHGVGGGEIEAADAGFQADQEYRDGVVVLEAVHFFLALLGRAVEVATG